MSIIKGKKPPIHQTPPPDDVILSLDIGTEFVKAVIARQLKDNTLEIIGVGRAHQDPSNMHAGAIADIGAVVATCERALSDAEKQAGVTCKLVSVGIAGELIKGNTTSVHYRRKNGNRPLSDQEMSLIIKRVQDKAGELARKEVAIETDNPDIEVRLINSAIEKVCAELSLDLLSVAVEPFAVCRACLGDDPDSNLSAIVMDIGGGTTDIAVVDDGGVDGTKMFGIGGRSFTHQIAESIGVDYDTAEYFKLNPDSPELPVPAREKLEDSIAKNLAVWVSGVQLALGEFNLLEVLPQKILLCGGGAGLIQLQEELATSDWYIDLPFTRRPVVHLVDSEDIPGIINSTDIELDHSFITALGLLRVSLDTLAGSPDGKSIRARISKILQN